MTPDYEAEYNNRARVPEHPAIIAGWQRDAAEFRATAAGELGIRYGDGPRQELDLFGDGTGPILLFVHGGYWQGLDRSYFSHLARGPLAHGVTVALPSYDLCPAVRVGAIVDEIRAAAALLVRRFGRPLAVAGHSAGGHLTTTTLATDWTAWEIPGRAVLAGYAISGLFDLLPLVGTSINGALGLDEEEARLLSPLLWEAPRGTVLDAVVGSQESAEYLRQSGAIVSGWRDGGAETRFEAIDGANHFTVVAPLADPGSAMTGRVVELARMASA